ncbi:DNA modification system-associated small protein [Halomicrococcus sp. NG-SE-24]|uniref:DNA modification system-associated small protein n=1 Tax=Halomicrococcus sp. NG-SE-24 TaxID=3436928 RepID=UPI003D9838ED
MSNEIDQEIADTIREKADEFDLPPELLLNIYAAEQRVVNMERRSRIYKRVHELLEEHIEAVK